MECMIICTILQTLAPLECCHCSRPVRWSHHPHHFLLQEIAEHKSLPSFWVDAASRIDVASNTILHKLAHGELKETSGWLTPGKKYTIGVTSGASTPDKAVEEVMDRVFKIVDPNYAGVKPVFCGKVSAPEEH